MKYTFLKVLQNNNTTLVTGFGLPIFEAVHKLQNSKGKRKKE
jgi:hypothetical protein